MPLHNKIEVLSWVLYDTVFKGFIKLSLPRCKTSWQVMPCRSASVEAHATHNTHYNGYNGFQKTEA